MAEDQSSDEAKLKLLGQRVREGWAKLHPPTAQHRAAVREVVRQQIERVQQATRQVSHGEGESRGEAGHEQSQTKSKTAEKSKSGEVQGGDSSSAFKKSGLSKDHGHSH